MVLDTRPAGIFLYDDDFEYFRRATIGNERRVMVAIMKRTIMEGAKIGKKRQAHTKDIVFRTDDQLLLLYEAINDLIGNEELKRTNWRISLDFKNGHGDINEHLKEVDREFENWLKQNGKKYIP